MPRERSGWTDERRAAQAQRMREQVRIVWTPDMDALIRAAAEKQRPNWQVVTQRIGVCYTAMLRRRRELGLSVKEKGAR